MSQCDVGRLDAYASHNRQDREWDRLQRQAAPGGWAQALQEELEQAILQEKDCQACHQEVEQIRREEEQIHQEEEQVLHDWVRVHQEEIHGRTRPTIPR